VKRTSVGAAGITLLLSGALLTLVTTSQARTTAPQQYYLALGDSIAYGVQPAKASAGLPPSGFHTGYVDVFAARLRALAPKIRVVNYGCPGESTKTFIAGGCPWLAERRQLHDAFLGAQLAVPAAAMHIRFKRHEASHEPDQKLKRWPTPRKQVAASFQPETWRRA
jgi:hypothetical protein